MLPPAFRTVPSSGDPTTGRSRCRSRKRPCAPSNSRAHAARALLLRLSSRGRSDHYGLLTDNIPAPPFWLNGPKPLSTAGPSIGEHQFMLVDAATGANLPAFDHAHLAAVPDKMSRSSCQADDLVSEGGR